MAIPPTIRLIWLGSRLPALPWLAVRSLLARAGAERVVLHTDDPRLGDDPLVGHLLGLPGFALDAEPPDLADLPAPMLRALTDLAARLQRPAARADLLRLQILWQHGGLYVDTDVIALQPFAPLWSHAGVAGLEHVCLPAGVVHSRSPLRWARAGLLLGARELIRHLPNAPRAFATVAHHYDLACNNAVLGFAPRSAVVQNLLNDIAGMPIHQALELYELGPRLLERATRNRSIPGLRLLPPPVFFSLAPEICGAVLRPRPRRQPLWPHPDALLVHLYDSVLARQLGRPLDAPWLLGPGRRSWLAEWLAPWLDELAQWAPTGRA